MPILQVVVLGIIQGLTEFLPISSTAHLYLTSWLLNWQTEGLSFDIMLHIGTLASLLIYFIGEWVQIIGQGFGINIGRDRELKHNHMLLWLLVIATIPVGVAGFIFNKEAETIWRTPWVMGTMMIVVGILMWLAERSGRKTRDLASVSLLDAVIIGASQALAIVPGTSRSGVTITTGLFRNLTRESAARFSFFMSVPAIGGAAAKAVWELYKEGQIGTLLEPTFLIGVAVSGVTGCIVIAWFLQYLRRSSLRPFVYYRLVFGIIVLALAFIRRPA